MTHDKNQAQIPVSLSILKINKIWKLYDIKIEISTYLAFFSVDEFELNSLYFFG